MQGYSRNQKYAELCYRSWTFFKYSPKKSHVPEATLLEYNMMKNVDKRINTAKIKLFCATRWLERHLVLEEIIALYEPLLTTLQKIATEKGWDCKTANSAYSLIKSITDPTFSVALNVCSYSWIYKTIACNVASNISRHHKGI